MKDGYGSLHTRAHSHGSGIGSIRPDWASSFSVDQISLISLSFVLFFIIFQRLLHYGEELLAVRCGHYIASLIYIVMQL